VDQLAHDHGLPVSTVRLYQNRGLLPPPRKQGRVAFYGGEHRRRLRLIGELQARGFSLAAIRELFDGMAAGQSLPAVLGLSDGASTWRPEAPVTLTFAELLARLPGVEPTPELLARVAGSGLVQLTDDGRVTVTSPTFLEIGSRLIGLGVPGDAVLDEYDALQQLTDDIAARFTELFEQHFWAPFEAAGMPADQLTGLTGTLEQLGPLAEAVVAAALRRSMQRAAEAFLDEQADRLDLDLPRPGATPPTEAGRPA
jgi:DNA-binding transcriptional MerR regulator